MKKGIFLVANLISQDICENLIFSIRESGCNLPIRLVHFGGKKVNSKYILQQVEYMTFESFDDNAKQFIYNLKSVLTYCPLGFLYRYLAWFTDWDQFIYSDNDIVALCNWEKLFDYLREYDLVHADEEYTTKGIYNYEKPEEIVKIFGEGSLETAITAGHIIVKKSDKMINDIEIAVDWFKQNPGIAKNHDQSLLHITTLLGNWRVLNLCKSQNWLSSWAGSYINPLDLIHKLQFNKNEISHIHYSGTTPKGDTAIQEFLFSKDKKNKRLRKILFASMKSLSGYNNFREEYKRIKRFFAKF